MRLKSIYLFFLVWTSSIVCGQEEISFSPQGGPQDGAVTVKIDAGEGARIYYTLDGSIPSSASNRYTEKGIYIDKVAVIRAVAYVDGKRTSVKTQSYFCERDYPLPIVSIATEPGNLWDFGYGIYVKGCCADTIEPYLGANFWYDWEKPANIEMYEVDGTECFNQGVGITIFGGYSRMLPQKSLAVIARSKYGKNKIKYPIFPEREHSSYKSFIIRNSGGDFLRTHLRDAFMTQLAKPTGVAIQAYRPAIIFINGQYWGIQNLREKISEHYLKQNYGVDKNNVDILRHNGVARHGTSKNYKKLLAYLNKYDLSQQKWMDSLRTFMDVEDYIRYNIAEVYSDNRDAGGNIRYWRERNDSAKWRWVFYDLDLGLGNNEPSGYKRNTLAKFTNANTEAWPDPAWSTFIIRSLLKNKDIEYQYINTFADHLNTVYHPDTALRLFNNMAEVIQPEMEYHQKRWGSSYQNWQLQLNIVRKYVQLRPYYCRAHIMEKFQLKDTAYVSIVHPGKEVCDIEFSSLSIERNYKGIYFKNVPITIKAKAKHDYEFVGWKNRTDTSSKITFVLNKDEIFEPVFKAKRKSVFADSVIFNEICFKQIEGDSSGDWIELYNRSSQTIQLNGWGFTDKSYKKRAEILGLIEILPGQHVIWAEDSAAFAAKYNADTIRVIGSYSFGLSSKGELIKLYDNEGFLVDSLTYFQREVGEEDFTLNLNHVDANRYESINWEIEAPNPGRHSDAYLAYLKHEAEKRYWTRIYYIGGGSFFFILVGGLWFYRYSKKHKKNKI